MLNSCKQSLLRYVVMADYHGNRVNAGEQNTIHEMMEYLDSHMFRSQYTNGQVFEQTNRGWQVV